MIDIAQPMSLVKAVADSHTAGLRGIVPLCTDRDTARRLYTELLRLAAALDSKHHFNFKAKYTERAERV